MCGSRTEAMQENKIVLNSLVDVIHEKNIICLELF